MVKSNRLRIQGETIRSEEYALKYLSPGNIIHLHELEALGISSVHDLLRFPGVRKAKPGVLFRVPEGLFHARSLYREVDGLPENAQHLLEYCTPKEALRVVNIKNPRDYLLKIRADALNDNVRLIRKILNRKEKWESSGKSWSLEKYYDTLNLDANTYVKALSKRKRTGLQKIPYGKAPLREPNGLCFRSILGDFVVVSDSLHSYFYYFLLANLGCFYGLDLEQRTKALMIAFRVMLGTESPDFELDPREKIEKRIASEVKKDVGWMMQFTFGHEFAHYNLGHLDAVAPSRGRLREGAESYAKALASDILR